MSRNPPPHKPWYRQLWPWLLMTMPAAALVSGAITFWLAATTNNPLVVDDYYREGKAINLQLARDEAALRLGLVAELESGPDGAPRLRLAALPGSPLPPFVTVRLVHATRAEFDRGFTLAAAGGGLYTAAQGPLPADGRWNVVIEDPDRRWRLVGVSTGFGEQAMRLGGAPR